MEGAAPVQVLLCQLETAAMCWHDGSAMLPMLVLQVPGDRALTLPWPGTVPPETASRATALAWRALALQQQQPGLPAPLAHLTGAQHGVLPQQQQQLAQAGPAGAAALQGQWQPVQQDWAAAAAWQQQQLMPMAAQQWQQLQQAQQPAWLVGFQAGLGLQQQQQAALPGQQGPTEEQQQADDAVRPAQAVPLQDAFGAHSQQQQQQQVRPALHRQQQQQHRGQQPHELQVHSMQPGRPGKHAAGAAAAAAGGSGSGGGGAQRGRGSGGGAGRPSSSSSSRPAGLSGPGPPSAAAAGNLPDADAAVSGQQQQQMEGPAGMQQRPQLSTVRKQQGEGGSSKQLRVRNYNIADDQQAAALVATPAAVLAARQCVMQQQQMRGSGDS